MTTKDTCRFFSLSLLLLLHISLQSCSLSLYSKFGCWLLHDFFCVLMRWAWLSFYDLSARIWCGLCVSIRKRAEWMKDNAKTWHNGMPLQSPSHKLNPQNVISCVISRREENKEKSSYRKSRGWRETKRKLDRHVIFAHTFFIAFYYARVHYTTLWRGM